MKRSPSSPAGQEGSNKKKSVTSSPETKECAICLGSVIAGKGQAIFTAECSHSFHFGCITTSIDHGNQCCPICRANWKDLPFAKPNKNVTLNIPEEPQEPVEFADDEPLPIINATSASSQENHVCVIKAIPERPAVAMSESLSQFSVLVGLRAPSMTIINQRAPVDLVTVLDVSGSMDGSKLTLVKRALHFIIDKLGPLDRISIVSFSTDARRILSLRRMTNDGRVAAKRAIDSLRATGDTNIVGGLKKGVQVLEERRQRNPVASIIFLSDGRDTRNSRNRAKEPQYLHLLPASICPGNNRPGEISQQTFTVHSFGFGTDHDPIAMNAISDASAGTFSFIESYPMVQDAFASCIGGLLSVVTQELLVTMKSASNGVEIVSIPSGRYISEILNEGTQATLNIGELYADEDKEFLIHLSIPKIEENDQDEQKTSLLDITCTYRDTLSNENVKHVTVEIQRPEMVSASDMVVNLEVDRQKNRVSAMDSIAKAQKLAESGNLTNARSLLANMRSAIVGSPSGQAGDEMCMLIVSEMKETEERMESRQSYERVGRGYVHANLSSHYYQRASGKGMRTIEPVRSSRAPGLKSVFDKKRGSRKGKGEGENATIDKNCYTTPYMDKILKESQQLDDDDGEDYVPGQD